MKENPFIHSNALQPQFQEFYIYTGPECDDLDEDEDHSVTETTAQTHLDSDLGLDSGSGSGSGSGSDQFDGPNADNIQSKPSNPTSFPGKDWLSPTIVNTYKKFHISSINTPVEAIRKMSSHLIMLKWT